MLQSLLPLLILSLVLLAPCVAHAEFDARLGVASHYLYRGINQAGDGPVVQGMLSYTAASGIYGGVWASNVEFTYDDRSYEIDYFLGYQRSIGEAVVLDTTIVRYTYDRTMSSSNMYDWTELQVTLQLLDHWSITGTAAYDWLDQGENSYTAEATYRYAFKPTLMIDATLGQVWAREIFNIKYQWAEVGLTQQLGPLYARLAYSTTANAQRLGEIARSRWLVALTWQRRG